MKKLLLVPALLLVLSGCAGLAPKGGAAFSEASVEPGKALVYVYRLDTVSGEFTPRVNVTGAPSFDLPNASYAALNLAPGTRRVDVNWGKQSQIGPDTATLNLEAGRTYYLQVTSATHDGAVGTTAVFYMAGKSAAKLVERDEAMKALPKTKSVL